MIATSQVAQAATALGQRWQEAILDLCDDHFFFSQVGAGFATLLRWSEKAVALHLQSMLLPSGLL